jgi:pimeloyl-ACP methyl ester carboxylesterase
MYSFGDCLPSGLKHHVVAHVLKERVMHQTGSLDQVARLVTADRTLGEGKDGAGMLLLSRVQASIRSRYRSLRKKRVSAYSSHRERTSTYSPNQIAVRGWLMARIGEHAGVSGASTGGLPAAAATPMTQPHIEQRGEGPRVLFVHGSISGGSMTWKAQYPLAERWTLLVLDRRGFGESPPADGDDFEVDARDIAEALGDGAHLVGHSYGGVGALLAAAARPQAVHSLTLIEPAAYSVALDQQHVLQSVDQVAAHFAGYPASPREFLEGFCELMGLQAPPDPLPPALSTSTRLLMRCRYPWTALFPIVDLAKAEFRSLLVSGAHSPVFESICDVLAVCLGGERAVVAGAGHSVPRTGMPFNEKLEAFLLTSPPPVRWQY